jgi:glycosyltransferase involved in cell wall biosynthesis
MTSPGVVQTGERVLYISYDGMLEPLGQSQVLGYLCRLSAGRTIHLISFEKQADWQQSNRVDAVARRIAQAGIVWHPLRYHKSPTLLATVWDMCVGFVLGLWLVHRHRLGIVHARSYVAGVMAMCIRVLSRARFLFDMRGYWVDERVDGGLWPRGGWLYRCGKWVERRLLMSADHVVSLTQAAVDDMRTFAYLQGNAPDFTVIPTCADLERFKPASILPVPNPFVLGYVGSAGTWYLFDEVARSFALLRKLRPDAHFLVINRGEHAFVRERLGLAGIPAEAFSIHEATHAEVPTLIARMHAGVFFIRPAYSKTASAPTKLAEFLGCGIPCLCNAGVGDMAQIVDSENVGVTLHSLDEDGLEEGVATLLTIAQEPAVRARCVAAAHRHFSLDEGVMRYATVYRVLQSFTHT